MPARLAYPLIYHRLTDGLTDDGHDAVDALLGDVEAQRRINQAQLDMIRAAGGGLG